MTARIIDIEEDAGRVIIHFPYDRALVDVMRSLPGRSFDRDTKAWHVPLDHADTVVGRLSRHDFELSEELRAFFAREGLALEEVVSRVRQEHEPFLDEDFLPEGTWTVASLNHRVKEVLRDAFREEMWLAAEIQSFDRNRSRGHAFFELIHRPYQGGDPVARVRAVMWRDDRALVERKLAEDGGQVRLRDGLIVRVLARADFYTGQGRYQVSISDLDLAYTTGTLHQRREKIVRALERAGLLGQNVALPWPRVPRRLGLITSDGSDAMADFVHELERSGYGFEVSLFPVQVQGARTEASVLRALAHFAARADQFDAVAIVRGGGARSDLAYFDTQAIGEAVCHHPLKLIVGVGHQRDVCLLDFVAHSEKTPTAAAQFFVERVRQFVERQRDLEEAIFGCVEEQLARAREEMGRLGEHGLRLMERALDGHDRRIERLSYDISSRATARLERAQRRFDRMARAIPAAAHARVDVARARGEWARQRLEPARLGRALGRRRARLDERAATLDRAARRLLRARELEVDGRARRLELLDPRRVLERGFALVYRQPGGELVRDPAQVERGEALRVELARGQMSARAMGAGAEEE